MSLNGNSSSPIVLKPGGVNTLGEVLAAPNGNIMLSGQFIVGESGTGYFQIGDDSFILLASYSDLSEGYLFMDEDRLRIGFSEDYNFEVSNVGIGMSRDSQVSGNFAAFGISAISLVIPSVLSNQDSTIISIRNTGLLVFNSAKQPNQALFLNSFACTFNANVQRSVIASGAGITAKTNDTLYSNQISLQDALNTFDNVVRSLPGNTTDNVHSLQNKSGTLAHLNNTLDGQYVEKFTLYNATLNLPTWETIIIADAEPNSIIEMTLINNTGQNTIGVRQIGSIINRTIPSIANSATTMLVKTDALKQVEFATSDFNDTDFYFSAQL